MLLPKNLKDLLSIFLTVLLASASAREIIFLFKTIKNLSSLAILLINSEEIEKLDKRKLIASQKPLRKWNFLAYSSIF
jgi:hypothetical protein